MTKKEYIHYLTYSNYHGAKKRKGHLKRHHPEILIEVENYINYYNLVPFDWNDSLNYYLNNIIDQNICKVCKNISLRYNFQYCSNKCKKQDIHTILNKTHNTLKERYGSSSPLGKPGAKEKFKLTSLKNHGTEHPLANKKIQEKSKRTLLKNYGVENPSYSKKIQEKISIGNKKAHQERGKDIIQKRVQTNLKKYGEKKVLTSVAINNAKKTLQKKYGVDNPFMIHEDTYLKAGRKSIDYYNNFEKKNKSIQQRKQTNLKKYGCDPNNYPPFQEKRRLRIKKKIQDKIKDEIIVYNEFGILKCKCDKNHIYKISTNLLNSRLKKNNPLCTKCNPPINYFRSNEENELYNFISKYSKCEQNVKTISPRFEADIVIENKKLIFEFNGIYWHSDVFKGKNYHQEKSKEFKKLGYNTIHIWEDLWYNKKNIVYDRIKKTLGKLDKKINARECKLKIINKEKIKIFLEENHIQGFNLSGFGCFGLFNEKELIYAILIGKRNIGNKNKDYELLRACSKIGYNVRGGFSKLFKYVYQKYPGNYISYADLCWGEGNVYKYAGFKLEKYSKPNYWYLIDKQRFHRYTYRKSELVKMGYDINKTEFEIMNEDIKALRIYDCGSAVWKLNIKNKLL